MAAITRNHKIYYFFSFNIYIYLLFKVVKFTPTNHQCVILHFLIFNIRKVKLSVPEDLVLHVHLVHQVDHLFLDFQVGRLRLFLLWVLVSLVVLIDPVGPAGPTFSSLPWVTISAWLTCLSSFAWRTGFATLSTFASFSSLSLRTLRTLRNQVVQADHQIPVDQVLLVDRRLRLVRFHHVVLVVLVNPVDPMVLALLLVLVLK